MAKYHENFFWGFGALVLFVIVWHLAIPVLSLLLLVALIEVLIDYVFYHAWVFVFQFFKGLFCKTKSYAIFSKIKGLMNSIKETSYSFIKRFKKRKEEDIYLLLYEQCQ